VIILSLLVVPSAYGQLSDRTGLKQVFTIETGGYSFPVELVSNFNVEEFQLEQVKSIIRKLPSLRFENSPHKNGKIYRKLSVVEQGIPIMFIVLYSFVILIMLYPLIINLIMRLF